MCIFKSLRIDIRCWRRLVLYLRCRRWRLFWLSRRYWFYCFGNIGSGCPCSNFNDGSMGGCDWGSLAFPSGGVLGGTGDALWLTTDALLIATAVENDFGFFFGANNQTNGGNGNPLNDGLRCAGGGLVRLIPPTNPGSNTATHTTSLQQLDPSAGVGVTRRYQYWFRTPVGPCGQMANLTNGYEIAWMP